MLAGGDVVIADGGLPDDTFNLVCRARFTEDTASKRVADVIRATTSTGRPFSWWVAPTSTPANLGDVLLEHGLSISETEEAMVADLDEVPPLPPPEALTVVTVETAEQLSDYASLMAQNWAPPSPTVVEFYDKAATAIFDHDCASRFVVGYVGKQPVTGAEVHFNSGVAGLYGIVTLQAHRRKRFGTAATLAALDLARAAGAARAVLQASSDGAPVYEKIGFTTLGTYTEYGM